MRIAIIGAGAVGGWFGGGLIEAGHEVVFVARGKTLEVLASEGLRLNDSPPIPVTAVDSVSQVGQVDVVFLAVKVTNESDLTSLLGGLPTDVPVAVTQNSVEVPWSVAEVVGKDRTWPGVVRGYFHHTGPARVEFHGGPTSYTFGTWDGSTNDLAERFSAALVEAGVDSTVHPEIFVDVWEKAMFVTTTGALGALTQSPLGVLRTRHRGSLEALMREVYEAALASGVALPDNAVQRALYFADRMPADATSSMQRDLIDGRSHELDSQVGALCRMGASRDVDLRLHNLLLSVLG
ncbi:2-dehydropantoate 2-reductase [Corynebacterium alimapuense]|uniref:2-dehydropantoate 2-reductase n=1 Tax=Corynebacterium alimapuense TaxID=1576874 RepID=A0A3M8K6U8_9CORY|nr:2-dehydropantoate 2-reductase [Corynebacterium alimapuense]RNE48485.1 2-dehydropantoate 2-reductase [Corynebacterium alimapuense]